MALRPVAALLVLAAALPAAAEDSANILQVGYARLGTLSSRSHLQTEPQSSLLATALGVPPSFESPGAMATARPVQTLAVTLGREFSERLAVELDVGIPPVIEAEGSGRVSVPTRLGPQSSIDLGDPAYQPLGSARQWSPALLVLYHLRPSCRHFCPSVGIGGSYTWFTQVRLNPAFAAQVNSQYGSQLATAALKPGPTSTSVKMQPVLAPVLSACLGHQLSGSWGLTASVAYIPFSTTTEVRIHASDGEVLSTTYGRVKADALVAAVLLSYRW